MNRTFKPILLAIGLFFALAASVLAAPGDLDLSFGNGGIVITTVDTLPPGQFGSVDVANGMAIQPDGKIVVVGVSYTYSSHQERFAVVRYQPNGSLDSSFGGTGIVITPLNFSSEARSVALQPDGKIVVAGISYNGYTGDSSFAVVRYQPNGSLDTSFNGTGIVITPFSTFDAAVGLAIQADGKIVVVVGNSSNDSIIVRYNANGSSDTSFNGTGRIFAPFSVVTSAAIQADGKIVVVGSSLNSASLNKFTISRYTADGAPDTSFGGTGKVVIPGESPSQGRAYSVAIQPDGKIVAAGSTTDGVFGPDVSGWIVRCNPDGSLDTTFGGTGIVTVGIYINSAAVQVDGKIVAAGFAGNNRGGFDFAAARLNPNGSPDSTFGNGTGRVSTLIGGGGGANSVAIQADGKIVVAGYTTDQFDFLYFALVRYQGDAPSSSCSSPNPIDCPDFFVSQQYRDFLSREPEPSCPPNQCGLDFYLPILNGCGDNAECILYTRGALSANFFRSPEFGQKGGYVANLYNAAIGQRPKTVAELSDANKVDRPHYAEFMTDLASLSAPTDAETNIKKDQLAVAFLQRSDVQANLPNSLTNEQFVQRLESIAGVILANESTLIASLNNGTETRAQVLRAVAESNEVIAKFYIPNFVTMEYLGYLRRDPEDCHASPDPANCGYIFHNSRFNTPGADPDLIENIIVRGFIESPEYRGRFGLP